MSPRSGGIGEGFVRGLSFSWGAWGLAARSGVCEPQGHQSGGLAMLSCFLPETLIGGKICRPAGEAV